MRYKTILLILVLVLSSSLAADNLEKTQKKELEAQVKTMTAEAQKLEKAGQWVEARAKYAESQALIEMKDVTDAIKRLDDEIHKRVKDDLNQAHKLYETRKFSEAAAGLDEGMKLGSLQSVIAYDMALCYYQIGQRDKALEYLGKARMGTPDPKQKQKLSQLMTYFTTGENSSAMNAGDKDRIARINRLSDSIGVDASLEDAEGSEEPSSDAGAAPAQPAPANAKPPASLHASVTASRRSSLCDALAELKGPLLNSPSVTFDLANCAETNGRTAEAVRLLEKYMQTSPGALDAGDVRARMADLKLLLGLPGQNGIEVRRLYASVYGSLAERKYDRALADLNKAADLAPDFALTKWKLGLLHESMGNIDRARENFNGYIQLSSEQSGKDEAALHLSTLEAKKTKYDQEVDAAGDIVADLFNRAMNLTFNESENRSALRAKRALVKKKQEQSAAKGIVGGFAVPFAYAQQQLSRASEHLHVALALFPLGAEANQLMGLVYLQANDGGSAMRSFDVAASQGLPVSFYAELRGHKQDEAEKVELTRDKVRLIALSSYDKNGKAAPPRKPAGADGLGDLVVEPNTARQQDFDSIDLGLADIKKVETDHGLLKLKLAKQDMYLSPIYLPSFTPIEGPQARRFANSYTRLFVRYPGLEDSKLGTEGMSGGEKFAMGMNLATASLDLATSGFTPFSALADLQDVIAITRTIQGAMASLSVSYAKWEKSVNDQQQLLAGKEFKSIPVEVANLEFVQEFK